MKNHEILQYAVTLRPHINSKSRQKFSNPEYRILVIYFDLYNLEVISEQQFTINPKYNCYFKYG